MEKIIYSSQRKAITAIAAAYLSRIGFFDITEESFSTNIACTSHIKNVIKLYNSFMSDVVDRLENIEDNHGYYIAIDGGKAYVLEDLPEYSYRGDYNAFKYTLKWSDTALYYRYKPDDCSVQQLLRDEMSNRLSKYKEYFK